MGVIVLLSSNEPQKRKYCSVANGSGQCEAVYGNGSSEDVVLTLFLVAKALSDNRRDKMSIE
jgi:hypothetical protein